MNLSETLSFDRRRLAELQKLVGTGEGFRLEFKRKAAHPDKIVRELIAFANSEGGILLIGVDDAGGIPGVKYPEEEIAVIQQSLHKHCRPNLEVEPSIIPLSAKHFVVQLDVAPSEKRPHFFLVDREHKECYVRVNDMTIKASREVVEIVRRSKKKKDIRFTFGDSEKKLMEHLERKRMITLAEFRSLAGLNRFLAAKKLVLLVLANVLRVTPTEKGDEYSLVARLS